jgi:hypothetical protein
MSNPAQRRANKSYRSRLGRRGIARFEVMAPDSDRELIRALARTLAEGGPDAGQTRTAIRQALSCRQAGTGAILAALRRSPMVGVDIDLGRTREPGRKVDL